MWIREEAKKRTSDVIYVTPNHYDGGYEVRVGTVDFFVDYEAIDAHNSAIFDKYL